MAIVQNDGTTAVTATSTKNDYGVIRHAGTIADSRFASKGLGDNDYVGSPQLVEGMPNMVIAEDGGTFGTMTATSFIIRRITTMIAGLSNTALLSGGSDNGQRRSIHSITGMKTTFLSQLRWQANRDGQPTYTATKTTRTLSFGTDDAAVYTNSVPGELTINQYGTPTNKDYSSRTL